MTDTAAGAAPGYVAAVEAVVEEYERHAAWLAELEDEVRAARARRTQLAESLERLFRTLPPETVRRFAPRLADATGRLPERRGRPAEDGRHRALMQTLVDWPHETITTGEATGSLRALGYDLAPRYSANALFAMARKGMVTQLGHGKYRITRTHPELLDLSVRLMEAAAARV